MSSFTIYPAIDMRGGKCVRLFQGDYDKETVYADSPLAVAKQFQADGAEWIHMVDLDGAKKGEPVNAHDVFDVKNRLDVGVQIGGGIRTKEDVSRYLDGGVDRVILGSSAISEPAFVKEMLAVYGKRIVIGIDARDGYVAVEGWTKTSAVKAEALALELIEHGAETFIFTDISRDGALTGPNVEAVTAMARVTGKEMIASGGVSHLDDVKVLSEQADHGVSGVIIGRALYTKAFTVKDALEAVGTSW